MAKNTTPYMLQADAVSAPVTFVNADGTTIKDLCTAAADGSYLYEIAITSDDTATKDITLYLNNGAIDIPIKLATVAINQGTVIATPDPLRFIQVSSGFIGSRLLDRDQNYYLQLPAGYKIRMKCNANVTAAKTITVICYSKSF